MGKAAAVKEASGFLQDLARRHGVDIDSLLLDLQDKVLPLESPPSLAERRHAGRLAWAKDYGSPHLQAALMAGYDCKRSFVLERVSSALPPGGDVDWKKEYRYQERPCPSQAGLNFANRVHQASCERLGLPPGQQHTIKTGMAVWLVDGPDDPEEPWGYVAREGVVIDFEAEPGTVVRVVWAGFPEQ